MVDPVYSVNEEGRLEMAEALYAVNENGEMLQDLIMCDILGVDKLPDGFEVAFVNGNTLDCQRKNLRLVKTS
jgi:hypothetical protein